MVSEAQGWSPMSGDLSPLRVLLKACLGLATFFSWACYLPPHEDISSQTRQLKFQLKFQLKEKEV